MRQECNLGTHTHALSAEISLLYVSGALSELRVCCSRLETDFVVDIVQVKLRGRNGGESGRVRCGCIR